MRWSTPLYRLYAHRLAAALDRERLPGHIGVILDGHRRFARAEGLDDYASSYGSGMGKLEELIEWCAENSRLPARDYWDDQWVQTLIRPLAVAGVEPFASRLRADPDEEIQIFRPEDIHIVVTGGETQAAWKMFGGRYALGGRGTANVVKPTISIDAWR